MENIILRLIFIIKENYLIKHQSYQLMLILNLIKKYPYPSNANGLNSTEIKFSPYLIYNLIHIKLMLLM